MTREAKEKCPAGPTAHAMRTAAPQKTDTAPPVAAAAGAPRGATPAGH